MEVKTCSLVTDQELIEFILHHRPAIVSIDSPLGFPGGADKIDPAAGIVRVAEHDLSSVGIPAYPALIDSMRELTLRGVALRKIITSWDCPPIVIESYPGAAQDVLCIPRKQKSLELLRNGLKELGLTGPGLLTESHDEMDAITSAVVGRFFEAGQFLAMGIPSEAQLIVPKIAPLSFDPAPIICLAGKTGAGKSVISRYLALFYGFRWIRTRDLIRDILLQDAKRDVKARMSPTEVTSETITDQHLRDFGVLILEKYKQEPLRRALNEAIEKYHAPTVIDSIRDVTDLDFETNRKREIHIWYIDCNDSLISNRLSEKSKIRGYRGRCVAHSIDQNIGNVRKRCDRVIANIGTLEDLRWKIDDSLFEVASFARDTH
jgi:predicted nuclease with RNAse H fold/dephospho-CoA kinase